MLDKSSEKTLLDTGTEEVGTEEEGTEEVGTEEVGTEVEKSGGDPSRSQQRFIDPHELTGKTGLERMMNFVDNKSPPVKGSFEYKKTTLTNYGRIFSTENIGNYSAKIKSVLDNIVNPETGNVSDGIILIYSQYIDSGLIPMALALEEAGFTRFGDKDAKSLFKRAPT